MCAINPVHKKRIVFDVYTSDRKMSEEDFAVELWQSAMKVEQQLNSDTSLRWHLKDTDQQAE